MKTKKPKAAAPDPNLMGALASLLEANQVQATAAKTPEASGKQVALRSRPKAGQTPEAHRAEMAVEGVATNALVTLQFTEGFTGNGHDLTNILDSVRSITDAVKTGDHSSVEAILGAQVVSLNVIYTHLASKAAQYLSNLDTCERLARLAFKAQSQCRATAESLAFMRNPGGAVFAKQANIAHGPQQVNNGTAPTVPTRADESQSQPNELIEPRRIEAAHGPMDTRTTRATSATDSRLAPVGQVHRAAKRRG